MNNETLAISLMQAAERMQELANNLGGRISGKQLTQRERQLCRAALLPNVQEMIDQILIDYIQGTPIDSDGIANVIRDLEIL